MYSILIEFTLQSGVTAAVVHGLHKGVRMVWASAAACILYTYICPMCPYIPGTRMVKYLLQAPCRLSGQ